MLNLSDACEVTFHGGPVDGLKIMLSRFIIRAQADLNEHHVLAWKVCGVWYEDNGPTDPFLSNIDLCLAPKDNAKWLESHMPKLFARH